MNLNLIYDVKKCRHLESNYIYLYGMECDCYSVLVYEDDDDTPVSEYTQFFTNYTDALHYYNETKKKLKEEKQ